MTQTDTSTDGSAVFHILRRMKRWAQHCFWSSFLTSNVFCIYQTTANVFRRWTSPQYPHQNAEKAFTTFFGVSSVLIAITKFELGITSASKRCATTLVERSRSDLVGRLVHSSCDGQTDALLEVRRRLSTRFVICVTTKQEIFSYLDHCLIGVAQGIHLFVSLPRWTKINQ